MARLANIGVGGTNPVRIMGILNASPESFYKKSVKISRAQIRDAAKGMEDGGADLVDVGGMSTAPYLSTAVSERTEIERVLGALRAVQSGTNLPVSVDTCRSGVAEAALENGAEIINDVSGLKHDPGMAAVVSRYRPSLILCAFHGGKGALAGGGLIPETRRLLDQSVRIATGAGASARRIVLDPSIGFFRKAGRGNSIFTRIGSDWAERDVSVLRDLRSVGGRGRGRARMPVMVSVSNKSFIGAILQRDDPADRLFGSVAAEVASVMNGADAIRTHCVSATRDAISVAERLLSGKRQNKGL